MGNVFQTGPLRFSMFNTDINFSRAFYPIIIINIIFGIWFGILSLIRSKVLKSGDLIDEEKKLHHTVIDNITQRVVNFVDQIWRYQFLATLWLCFLQFYNLAYPQNSDRNQTINSLVCILSLICTLAWPGFVMTFARKKYYEKEYS